ncbi:MAG: hypothetical protein M1817_002617 [Caeruleum heppii]|nr:MAG: hypothetical protein M1817_002617 [Caeruleum heppii]
MCHLVLLSDRTGAVFDPKKPHTEENFDPAEADPLHNITCVGPLPPFPLPRFDNWDPNTFTLQELCAKPQYGGRAPDQHLGYFCLHPGFWSRAVVASINPTARVSLRLSNPRLMLYCRTRCFCNSPIVRLPQEPPTPIQNLDDPNAPPYPVSDYYRADAEDVSAETYQIEIDVYDDFPEQHVNWRAPTHFGTTDEHVLSTPLLLDDQMNIKPTEPDNGDRAVDHTVSIHPANRVACDGPMPRFPLPAPASVEDFESLQDLCAVMLSGGDESANAGAYCHRNSDGTSDVNFAEEMTPRLDWAWAGNNFLFAATMRYHCWKHCRCANPPAANNRTMTKLWAFLASADLIEDSDGSLTINVRERDGQPARTLQILPSQPRGKGPTTGGTCGLDGKQFCPIAFPSRLLGPAPTPTPLRVSSSSPSPPVLPPAPRVSPPVGRVSFPARIDKAIPLPRCGAQCVSNRDCHSRAPSSDTTSECRCVVPSVKAAQIAGVDPVFPVALCLATAQMGVKPAGRKRNAETQSGVERLELKTVDQVRVEDLVCPCNRTYVSQACCGSAEGMVWEDPRLRLGRLA